MLTSLAIETRWTRLDLGEAREGPLPWDGSALKGVICSNAEV